MEFRERLQKATERGREARTAELRAAAAQALSEEECRQRHSEYRLALADHIEHCLRDLADNFPGFRLEMVVDDRGWGAVASRDDMGIAEGRRVNAFSRLQIVVGPYGKYQVLEILAKGTVRNKETFTRNHYQRLAEVDLERFREFIEQWVLDYAEMYASAV
jgi:hypothetical protein